MAEVERGFLEDVGFAETGERGDVFGCGGEGGFCEGCGWGVG
jgi:hypothetical protein